MNRLRNISIKRKLTLIVMLPSAAALLLAGLVSFAYDVFQLRKAMVQEITMLSQVIGANNSAALIFDDQKSTTDDLALLSGNSHVVSSCVYTVKGEIFGSYFRKDMKGKLSLPPLQEDGHTFGSEYLTIFKKIEFNNKTVGTVYLQYDLQALHARMNGYMILACVILLMSACVIFLMSSWLNRTISEPVLSLAQTAKTISTAKNYSVRAEEHGQDEIGIFVKAFNEMLEQIQARDLKLAKHREELEEQVAIRTAELEESNTSLRTQITENAKIEEELFRTRQLESLGILAGGIAHDFNNLLTAILGHASLIKRRASPDDKIYESLGSIETASIRASDLTYQLLTFAKGGAPIKKLSSIAEVIGDSARFVFRGSNSLCTIVISDDLWPVEVDTGQISQVIHNLAINAHQAMPDGGEVNIQAENITVDPKMALSLQPGRYIRVSIQDNGTGIPKDQLAQIFNPYFTTKQHGSGLGLATSYSIIRKHNGLLTVESEVDKGTLFRVYLPAAEKEMPKTEEKPDTGIVGVGRILVMDDEEIVRDVTREILSQAGYSVDVAPDGDTTIDMYIRAKESGTSYDLIIMDLTIPGGMSGRETVAKLLESVPDARVIAASGYAQGPVMSDFSSYGFKAIITKPFRIEELCAVVHAVIQQQE